MPAQLDNQINMHEMTKPQVVLSSLSKALYVQAGL